MPELPEVETIRRGLEKYIIGYKLTHVEIRLPKVVTGNIEEVIGATIEKVERFGKGLVVSFDNGYSIAIHVKMTGQLIVQEHVYPPVNMHIARDKTFDLPNKWTHVIFSLVKDDGSTLTLFYNDIRQFGWIRVVKTEKIAEEAFFKHLGKEPLKDLTMDDFADLLKLRKNPIKQLLMDQSCIAGVGNIYANDALWEAQIDPRRESSSLTYEEQNSLFSAVEKVLAEGIERGGASETNYINVKGGKGSYQEVFRVYKKDGKVCPRCGGVIEKIRLGGRGTWFCSGCQR